MTGDRPRSRTQAGCAARARGGADSRGLTSAGRRFSLSCASLATATLVCALAACSAQTAETPATLPAGVEVELFQLRSDVAERGAQVRVVNGSDTDLVVTKVTFEDDWFADASVRERTSTIAAGRTIDLRIALPESACDDVPDADDRASRVTLELASGASATVEVADPLGFTALIHQKECLRHDLAQVTTLEWAAFTPSAAPQPAELRLAVTPAGGAGRAQLIEVQTTNLLVFAGLPAAFPLALQIAGTDADTTVAVPIVPLRCDPHAVMEDKRGTVFNVAVEAGGTAGVVEVAASETMRGEILRWVADWCGFGPG